MRSIYLLAGMMGLAWTQLSAQRACYTAEYFAEALARDLSFSKRVERIESFIRQHEPATGPDALSARLTHVTIKIPVVVHILYHQPHENISDEKISDQIDILNRAFRKRNSDTSSIPDAFKAIAADCEIEFALAISDPQRKSTTGIIHKYTPIAEWNMDDKMKFSSEMGDDAWDPDSYLNIWVCNIRRVVGYASVPGTDPSKDGVVLDYGIVGTNTASGYEMGKTAVHEVGHWLGLKHIWGDEYCGDDLVGDTPTQSDYTVGCPTAVRRSCNNGPAGNMYMNFMDYSNDACIVMFSEGQKQRMRSLFENNGPRRPLLLSKGLSLPLIVESPLPDESPKWLHPRVFPNPATNELLVDVAFDPRWIGKTLSITDMAGRVVHRVMISSKLQAIDISRLKSGLYFVSSTKEDGSYIKQKFIKI